MIYRSNLTCPDLAKQFKHCVSRPMGHSFGHDVMSDWADKKDDDPVFGIYKKCGFWTQDEAAILYHAALKLPAVSTVGATNTILDIGTHTGWTAMHVAIAGFRVIGLDPMYANAEFLKRAMENTSACFIPTHRTSRQFFADIHESMRFSMVIIDGDHSPGYPLEDAQNAAKHLTPTGVIILHDGIGPPVREAVTWLLDNGFKARIYWSPHLVFCAWRGDFIPPDHTADPAIDWTCYVREFSEDFDLSRLS